MSKHYKDSGRGFGKAEDIGSALRDDPMQDPRIERELEEREELIWAGRPDPKLMGCRSTPAVIFGIPWTAFSVFWVYMAGQGIWGGSGPGGVMKWLFPLFGVPFVLIGIGMLSAPWWAGRAARKTLYALTDRRCVIWRPGFRSISVKSYGPDDLDGMSRVERRDGVGDVIFVRSIRIREPGSSSDTVSTPEGFMGVADVRTLERLIRDTLLTEFPVPGETRY